MNYIVDGADAVGSFAVCSPILWKLVVPPASTTRRQTRDVLFTWNEWWRCAHVRGEGKQDAPLTRTLLRRNSAGVAVVYDGVLQRLVHAQDRRVCAHSVHLEGRTLWYHALDNAAELTKAKLNDKLREAIDAQTRSRHTRDPQPEGVTFTRERQYCKTDIRTKWIMSQRLPLVEEHRPRSARTTTTRAAN